MRYPHYIKPAVGGRWPLRLLCVDTVSKPDRIDAQLPHTDAVAVAWHCELLFLKDGIYHSRGTQTGSGIEPFWLYLASLLSDTRSLWVLSANCGCVWPHIGVWTEIESRRLEIVGTDPYDKPESAARQRDLRKEQKDQLGPMSAGARNRSLKQRSGMLVVADPPNIMTARVRGNACRLTWIDARNYSVELPKDTDSGADTVTWLRQFWQQYHDMCQSLNLGSAKATTGSQALHGWRAGYYSGGVYAGGTPAVTDLEERSMYGGRCEAFRVGEIAGPVYHLDIRSAYAAMCVRESVPIRLKHYTNKPPLEKLSFAMCESAVIASVLLKTPERTYPYRRSHYGACDDGISSPSHALHPRGAGTDIIYPIGTFNTVLCGPELELAMKYRRVLRCNSMAEYHRKPILREYAKAVYAAREQADRAGNKEMATVCKSLLVSIVGKFGQRDRHWNHCPDMWSDMLYGEYHGSDAAGRPCRYRSLGGVIQRDEVLGLTAEAVPSITAWILSAARVKLWALMWFVGMNNVYYCDTDSIMVTAKGFKALDSQGMIKDKQLGELYLHGVYQHVSIRGVKHYVADGRVVCSGLPRGHCQDVGDGEHYRYSIHAGESIANRQRPSYSTELRRYQRQHVYTHGTVNRDGTVSPIELAEG